MIKPLSAALALCAATTASAVPVSLHHSGRLLDASGTPLQGAQALELRLYDSATGTGTPVHTTSATPELTDGYYGVTLDVDSQWLTGALWLEVRANERVVGPRQPLVTVPRAAVAYEVDGGRVSASDVTVEGDGHLVLGQDNATDCDRDGALAYNPDSASLRLCVGGAWRTMAALIESVEVDGVRQWPDGRLASSCEDYRRPAPGFAPSLQDGLYRIEVNSTPVTVRCDMTRNDGGWTLVLASSDLPNLSGSYNDFWYTTRFRGPTVSTTPSVLIETNGLLQNNAYWTDVRFTVDVDDDYTYVLDRGVWDGGTAQRNDPRFVRFNTGINGQFWQGIPTCSSGCHSALAVPSDGEAILNGHYRIWGHTNGPPTWGLESQHGLDIWVR